MAPRAFFISLGDRAEISRLMNTWPGRPRWPGSYEKAHKYKAYDFVVAQNWMEATDTWQFDVRRVNWLQDVLVRRVVQGAATYLNVMMHRADQTSLNHCRKNVTDFGASRFRAF